MSTHRHGSTKSAKVFGAQRKPAKAKDAHAIKSGKLGSGGLAKQVRTEAAKKSRKPNLRPGGGGGGGVWAKGSKRRTNAEPAGGGGGIWRKEQDKLNLSRAKNAANGRELRDGESGLTFGAVPDFGLSKGAPPATGTSIFDPVLAELLYRWFCPPGGLVLDPFAGGSVRGIVASCLGRSYIGVDLRPEQIAANQAQHAVARDPWPAWVAGDARELDTIDVVASRRFDFIFSCPPYGDLERYSDDPRDLSTMEYDEFLDAMQDVVGKSCALLADDRFACFVVGDFRDSRGAYRAFPSHVIEMFQAAGLDLYNDAVLITSVGSLPARVRIQFETSRKLGKTHQNVLVFCKGDAKRATQAIGAVEFGDGPAAPGEDGESETGALPPAAAGGLGGEI